MTAWWKKIVLLCALALMPLQGIAAAALVMRCHADAPAGAAHVAHAPGNQDGTTSQDPYQFEAPESGSLEGSAMAHSCFHHFVSALPTAALAGQPPSFSERVCAPYVFYDLFIPERPQRPPLI